MELKRYKQNIRAIQRGLSHLELATRRISDDELEYMKGVLVNKSSKAVANDITLVSGLLHKAELKSVLLAIGCRKYVKFLDNAVAEADDAELRIKERK